MHMCVCVCVIFLHHSVVLFSSSILILLIVGKERYDDEEEEKKNRYEGRGRRGEDITKQRIAEIKNKNVLEESNKTTL